MSLLALIMFSQEVATLHKFFIFTTLLSHATLFKERWDYHGKCPVCFYSSPKTGQLSKAMWCIALYSLNRIMWKTASGSRSPKVMCCRANLFLHSQVHLFNNCSFCHPISSPSRDLQSVLWIRRGLWKCYIYILFFPIPISVYCLETHPYLFDSPSPSASLATSTHPTWLPRVRTNGEWKHGR